MGIRKPQQPPICVHLWLNFFFFPCIPCITAKEVTGQTMLPIPFARFFFTGLSRPAAGSIMHDLLAYGGHGTDILAGYPRPRCGRWGAYRGG